MKPFARNNLPSVLSSVALAKVESSPHPSRERGEIKPQRTQRKELKHEASS